MVCSSDLCIFISGTAVADFVEAGDNVFTGSFDRTKNWSTETGKCYRTFRGHRAAIVCVSFNLQSTLVETGSMDTTAKLQHIEKGEERVTLSLPYVFKGVPSFLSFLTEINNSIILTTISELPEMLHTLKGCQGEISSEQFTWDCSLIVTGSMDKTFMMWNSMIGTHIATLRDHNEEILDVFDYMGQCIATASTDGDQQVYNAETKKCIAKLEGHRGEISKGAKITPAECDPD
ncbi:LOW QUALITY PROTEIN: dynein assembly factor with WD repeat domains 1 [Guaruba guarouba]